MKLTFPFAPVTIRLPGCTTSAISTLRPVFANGSNIFASPEGIVMIPTGDCCAAAIAQSAKKKNAVLCIRRDSFPPCPVQAAQHEQFGELSLTFELFRFHGKNVSQMSATFQFICCRAGDQDMETMLQDRILSLRFHSRSCIHRISDGSVLQLPL